MMDMHELSLQMLGDYIFQALAPGPLTARLRQKGGISREQARTVADDVIEYLRTNPEKVDGFVRGLCGGMEL